MIQSEYNCTQQELYTVARAGWNACSIYILDFGNLKAMYDPALVTARIAEIVAASELPDEQERGEISETLHGSLELKNEEALDVWQGLKRYISSAFPKNQQKAKLESAGHDYYEGAMKNDWDQTEGLLTSGSNFIANNMVVLQANNNMPASFAVEFNTIRTEFLALHQEFFGSRGTTVIGTQAKILANNAIYENLITMLLDGQYIFRKDAATKKLFVFAEMLYKAKGAGTAGIKGTVTDAITHLPLKNVEISLLTTVKKGKTGEDGKYEITRVAHGIFNIEVRLAGYQTRVISEFEILIGTVSTLNVELTPVAP